MPPEAGSAVERLDAAVLLPRPELLEDGTLAPSQAVLERRQRLARSTRQPVPERVWQPGAAVTDVFQRLGYGTPRTERGLPVLGPLGSSVTRLENLGGYVVYEPRGALSLDNLRQELGKDYLVARDLRIFQQSPLRSEEAGRPDGNHWIPETGIARARELDVSGNNVRFGVVDTGIDAGHEEFQRRAVPFLNVPYREDAPVFAGRFGFDPFGHGSHVASVMMGRNCGVAPQARLHMAAVAEGVSLTSHMRRIVQGLDWLYETFLEPNHPAAPIIVNLSLGFNSEAPPGITPDDYRECLDAIATAVELMIDDNMLVVAAVGNDGQGRYRLPAGLDEVVGVGATDAAAQEVMWFSGSVPKPSAHGHGGPDIMGIGENVAGASARNTQGLSLYAQWSGTSQAAAYVSGIAALYWSMNRRMKASEIRQLLLATARLPKRLDREDRDRWGAGLARFDPPPELVNEWLK